MTGQWICTEHMEYGLQLENGSTILLAQEKYIACVTQCYLGGQMVYHWLWNQTSQSI